MKALARISLVVILLFVGVSSVFFASCSVDTVVPYEFPHGVLNIIQYSENPAFELWNFIEEKYPLFRSNYSVMSDGWLEVFINPVNGTRPDVMINGEMSYRTKNLIHSEQVYEGDFFELVLYPQEYLEDTNTITVEDQSLIIYDLYSWPDLIGEIVYRETSRPEINCSIQLNRDELIEDDVVVISAGGTLPGYTWIWSLSGDDVDLECLDSHLITPPLDYGEYIVSLDVEDSFGHTDTVSRSFTVAKSNETLLYNPELVSMNILDISYPVSVEPNILLDIWVTVNYSTPVSRDMQITIVDSVSGSTVSSIDDILTGEGTETYALTINSNDLDMFLDTHLQFKHEEEWINKGLQYVTISVTAPIKEKTIPGFPLLGLITGLSLYFLNRRESISPYK
jgi:hypothetical protein